MEGIVVSKKESNEFRVINDFVTGKITRKLAAELLNVNESTVRRKARKIEKNGLLGIKHGNCGKPPHNRVCVAIEAEFKQLMRQNYYDYNMTHMYEELSTKYLFESSYDTLRRWCHEEKLVKRKHKRRPKRPLISRKRMSKAGLMLQMDGSHHFFVPCKQWVLVAGIDDSTNEVPYGEFFEAETTESYFKLLANIIKLKGIPYSIYVDRAGCLGGAKRVEFGQFVRACEELGIQVIFANSPQAKGRIERYWQVVQDRCVAEFRANKITTIKEANHYFNRVFLKTYWNEYKTHKSEDEKTAYRSLPNDLDLNQIFCFKHDRKIANDHTVQWKKQIYQLLVDCSIAKQVVEIREYLNGTLKFYFAGRPVRAKPLKSLKQSAA